MDCPLYKVKKCLKGCCIWLTKDRMCSLLLMGIEKGERDEC
nr:MAG TPA: hypothetical protein [Caudoviricetes sp.]